MTTQTATRFEKDKFNYHGGYLSYNGKFVARFKYASTSSAGPFQTFLRKNFTIEEYFARHEAGEAPLKILESKGFILSHIKKWLKDAGYPITREGYEEWFEAQHREWSKS